MGTRSIEIGPAERGRLRAGLSARPGRAPRTAREPPDWIARPRPSHLRADDSDQQVDAIAISDSRSVAAGTFAVVIDVAPWMLMSRGAIDVFIAQLGVGGDIFDMKAFGSTSEDSAQGLAVAAGGRLFCTGGTTGPVDWGSGVIVAGDFEGTIDIGGGVLDSAGTVDVFVAKLGVE